MSDNFQNLCGIHQHLVKRAPIVSPSCYFNSEDFTVFPGCLFHSVPCKSCDKPWWMMTIFCPQIALLLNAIRSLLTPDGWCAVHLMLQGTKLWKWLQSFFRQCLHREGDRQTLFLYTRIMLDKEKKKKSWRLNKVIQSLLSAEQALGQNEMRRDQVIFVGSSKPKTWWQETPTEEGLSRSREWRNLMLVIAVLADW